MVLGPKSKSKIFNCFKQYMSLIQGNPNVVADPYGQVTTLGSFVYA